MIKFHTNLFNNFCSNKSNFAKFTLIKLRQIYREVAVIPADDVCKITWKTVEK